MIRIRFSNGEYQHISSAAVPADEEFPEIMTRDGFSDNPDYIIGDAEQGFDIEFFPRLTTASNCEGSDERLAMVLMGQSWIHVLISTEYDRIRFLRTVESLISMFARGSDQERLQTLYRRARIGGRLGWIIRS